LKLRFKVKITKSFEKWRWNAVCFQITCKRNGKY